MRPLLSLAFALMLGLSLAGPLQAAGSNSSSTSSKPKNPDFTAGVKLVDEENYQAAIPYLEKAIAAEPKNADAQNYLGYSYRKLGNRDKAFEHYGLALAIEPDHLGANEYLGELYLEMGQVAKAEERLKVLDDACFFGCDEYYDLKKAVAEYKAKNGG